MKKKYEKQLTVLKDRVRFLERANEVLEEDLRFASDEAEDAIAASGMWREEAQKWRERYEQVALTPEIKADTEAAYKRGYLHARQSLVAWAVESLNNAPVPEGVR